MKGTGQLKVERKGGKKTDSLIRQVPTPRQRPRVRLLMPDLVVEVDERRLSRPDELDRDVERDRDDVLEGDERVEKGDESVERRVVLWRVVVKRPVRVLAVPGDLVEVVDDTADHTGETEEGEGEEAGGGREDGSKLARF
jgi:hypothetical protein